ncbi:MAG: sensor histidine kinase [Planctomycetota bacterium]|jgi:signal transduction histidine kinase
MKANQDISAEQIGQSPESATLEDRAQDRSSCRDSALPSGKGPLRCPARVPFRLKRSLTRLKFSHLLIPLIIVVATVILIVGLYVIEWRVFPNISTEPHHVLSILWTGVVASSAGTIVYLLLRRRQRRLSFVADQLTRLLESRKTDQSAANRFDNPYLVHCREVMNCSQTDCPMYNSPSKRCWQVMALHHAEENNLSPWVEIEKCLKCDVYRISCPDKLTELGESFNNLLFLLEEEAKQVGRMRTQMIEKEKMVAIGQIATGIAHEVGNPLSSISSIVQILKREKTDSAMSGQLDLIDTHIQRISATVRRLINLARPVAEKWELVDINQVLEEVVRLIAFDRRARGVDIDFTHPESPLTRTYGLRGQLQQVFINLTLNALDAMPQSGKLTIRTEQRNGNIVVHIQDTGCGIPLEARKRIFDLFFTTKPPGLGTGLGLAVSNNIVKKHHGSIDFNSVVDRGTEFIVQLPVLGKAPEV